MTPQVDSTLFDTLSAVQQKALAALVSGQTVTAAAQTAGVHRSTLHLWTQQQPYFARALHAARQDRAGRMADELGDLADLALDTFRQLLTDPQTPAATRLKAAMEIVKLVEAQRPAEAIVVEPIEPIEIPASAPKIPANFARNAPCPCGSSLKFKRCCALLPPSATRRLKK